MSAVKCSKLLVTLNCFNEDKQALMKALVSCWCRVRAERIFQGHLSELLPQTTWVK
ncbi:metal-dependent hydrolase [Vibrio cholerae]|nr:metal-dependent hydrolase [Vibrio cholerae]ELV5030208.1 metal-dependent hydrolase [Vibrio cholerae]